MNSFWTAEINSFSTSVLDNFGMFLNMDLYKLSAWKIYAGISRRDQIQNKTIRKTTKVVDILERIARMKLKCAGHVVRQTDGKWIKKILVWQPRLDKRNRERTSSRWTDDIKRIIGNYRELVVGRAQERKQCLTLEEDHVLQRTSIADYNDK